LIGWNGVWIPRKCFWTNTCGGRSVSIVTTVDESKPIINVILSTEYFSTKKEIAAVEAGKVLRN